jgi:hypothetical protein
VPDNNLMKLPPPWAIPPWAQRAENGRQKGPTIRQIRQAVRVLSEAYSLDENTLIAINVKNSSIKVVWTAK